MYPPSLLDTVIKAADIHASLKEQGSLISDADILVAAIAIVNNLVLVTNNTNHFSRIRERVLSASMRRQKS